MQVARLGGLPDSAQRSEHWREGKARQNLLKLMYLTMFKQIKQLYKKDPIIPIYLLGFILLGIILFLVLQSVSSPKPTITTQSKAENMQLLNTSGLSSLSTANILRNGIKSDLYLEPQNYDDPLYIAKSGKGLAAVNEFINAQSTIPQSLLANEPEQQYIFPKDFISNSYLRRMYKDEMSNSYGTIERYYFNQTINGLEVLGAESRIDLQNSNKIVGLENELLMDESTEYPVFTQSQAEQVALDQAESTNSNLDFVFCDQKKEKRVIVNRQFLGTQQFDKNCISLAVDICNNGDIPQVNTTYYVCLSSGEVVFERNNLPSALSREISNCSTGSCIKSRSEGQAAVGDADVDNSYDILSDVYKYYFDTFGRDSFNSRGATLRANVKARSVGGRPCPNAMWDGSKMWACSGMVATDVWAHELTHGVVQYTAGLGTFYQSGALNEAFADVFGFGADPDDWTMGEDTVMGILRNFQSPPSKSSGIGPMPDRMFSPNFYCGSANDNGGVHHNSTVITKSLYLMITGGTFRDCNITPIDRSKILAVFYKALTSYLSSNANFLRFYNDMLKACGDLYGLSSTECTSVKAAMQSTELNQQLSGSQYGPNCPGSKATYKTPECAGQAGAPTSTPGPTGEDTEPTPTTSLRVSPTPDDGEPTPTDGESPADTPSPTDEEPTETPSITPEISPTPVDGELTPTPSSSQVHPEVKNIIYEEPCDTQYFGEPGWGSYRYAHYQCSDGRTGWSGDGDCRSSDDLLDEAVRICSGEYPEPTEGPEPTERPNPTPGKLQLSIRLKFQGVNYDTAIIDGMPIKVGLMTRFSSPIFKKTTFYLNSDNTWTGWIDYDPKDEEGYCLLIKGPYHIQRKVCHLKPQEEIPGSYRPKDNFMIRIKFSLPGFDNHTAINWIVPKTVDKKSSA